MTTILDVTREGWAALPAAAGWVIVVAATAHVMFGGFVGQELTARLQRRWAPRLGPMGRIRAELAAGRKFSADGQGIRPLTAVERMELVASLDRDIPGTLMPRAALYAANCSYCHAMWAAMIWRSCMAGGEWGTWIADCLWCGGAAGLLTAWQARRGGQSRSTGGGCAG